MHAQAVIGVDSVLKRWASHTPMPLQRIGALLPTRARSTSKEILTALACAAVTSRIDHM